MITLGECYRWAETGGPIMIDGDRRAAIREDNGVYIARFENTAYIADIIRRFPGEKKEMVR